MGVRDWLAKLKRRGAARALCSESVCEAMAEHNIVEQVLDFAQQLPEVDLSGAVATVPYRPSALAGAMDESVLRAQLTVQQANVALAVCESPALLFVDNDVVGSLVASAGLREFVLDIAPYARWPCLVAKLLAEGYRVGKIGPLASGGKLKVYAR